MVEAKVTGKGDRLRTSVEFAPLDADTVDALRTTLDSYLLGIFPARPSARPLDPAGFQQDPPRVFADGPCGGPPAVNLTLLVADLDGDGSADAFDYIFLTPGHRGDLVFGNYLRRASGEWVNVKVDRNED